MRTELSCIALMLTLAQAGHAAPVDAPNGTVTGHFGETEFDHPLLCERDPFVIARTHDSDGAPAFEAAFVSNGVTSVEIRTEDETHQFGTSTESEPPTMPLIPEHPASAVASMSVEMARHSAVRMGGPCPPSVMRLTQSGISVSEHSSQS